MKEGILIYYSSDAQSSESIWTATHIFFPEHIRKKKKKKTWCTKVDCSLEETFESWVFFLYPHTFGEAATTTNAFPAYFWHAVVRCHVFSTLGCLTTIL